MNRRSLITLGLLLAICLGVGALGGFITAGSVKTWYPTIAKPSLTPPDWVFAPVWTALYIMMAVAMWRVIGRAGFAGARTAFGLFLFQLALNLGWSQLFFGEHALGAATIEILVLLLAILATMFVFESIDRLAAALLVPYAVWVAFATWLTAAIWRLNP
jgi:tryptophan-rich sensory protein